MIPFRFGPSSRQLFGLHVPAGARVPRDEAVLLCNPFGQEAIRCHRLFRILGERLAREGYHVLRFDYYATGDSDGEDLDGDLQEWTGDVVRADEELGRRSGCARRSWFGLRFGATLAALASGQAPDAARRLVLWDPVLDGPAYLDELAGSHAAELVASRESVPSVEGVRAPRMGDVTELLGFALTARLVGQLRGLRGATLAQACVGRISVLDSGTASGIAPFTRALAQRGLAVDTARLDIEVFWTSDEAMNTAIVPAEAMHAITTRIAA